MLAPQQNFFAKEGMSHEKTVPASCPRNIPPSVPTFTVALAHSPYRLNLAHYPSPLTAFRLPLIPAPIYGPACAPALTLTFTLIQTLTATLTLSYLSTFTLLLFLLLLVLYDSRSLLSCSHSLPLLLLP